MNLPIYTRYGRFPQTVISALIIGCMGVGELPRRAIISALINLDRAPDEGEGVCIFRTQT